MSGKAIVVLSGGQDSTTCLYLAKSYGYDVSCVTFDYDQKHRREISAARVIAQLAEVQIEVIKLGSKILKGTSPLVSDEPLEQYASADTLPGGIEKTFVPMRNQLFLTVAANRAYIQGADFLFTGVGSEDYGGYPDCRRPFINEFELTCQLGTFTGEPETRPPLRVLTPLMFLSKKETVELALTLPDCYGALAYSHTSYAGEYPPKSKDHASLLRAKGFAEAGVPDPLVLRAVLEGKIKMPVEYKKLNGLDQYVALVMDVQDRIENMMEESFA
jgi:7-cyano-7-deazaguanine synthase